MLVGSTPVMDQRATIAPLENQIMTTTLPTPVGTLQFREAFELIRPELELVQPNELVTVNLDIPTSVFTVLGVEPKIEHHRVEIADQLPKFDLSKVDKVGTYARATGFAHGQYLAASKPIEPIADLAAELTTVRELLVSDVVALANRKLLDGERLKLLQGPSGFKGLTFDVIQVVSMMRDHWSEIEGKTAVSMQELEHAEQLAERLATAVGLRDQGPGAVTAASETRQRAFSLLVNAYDQLRRVLTFLRWTEDDIDQIAPSLYAGRGTSRKKTAPAPDPAPVPDNGTVAPANAAGAPAPAPANGTHPVISPGLPGNDPFGRG